MKVDIYKNLHLSRKMGRTMFSIKDRFTGRVSHYQSGGIFLKDVTFHVSKAGNQRVRTEQSKNVHAYVRGWVEDFVKMEFDGTVTYNPYIHTTFTDYSKEKEILTASYVWIDENGWIHYKL